jgi:hypothetical protein
MKETKIKSEEECLDDEGIRFLWNVGGSQTTAIFVLAAVRTLNPAIPSTVLALSHADRQTDASPSALIHKFLFQRIYVPFSAAALA